MILTSEKALDLLEQAKGKAPDDNWILHSICVGDTASKIAEALSFYIAIKFHCLNLFRLYIIIYIGCDVYEVN